MLNRRFILASLAATALPCVVAAEEALEAAARKEGAVTWYIAQVDAEAAEELGRRFTVAYPGIKVSAIRTTGQVAYQRLLLEKDPTNPKNRRISIIVRNQTVNDPAGKPEAGASAAKGEKSERPSAVILPADGKK